ncbi:MAG TPA: VWA domain-containing protein [Candidatus Dormibacteraeota bacterium]|nr:VWA domain-containing protein [Candidatus Dormibacteraeota bacterium]
MSFAEPRWLWVAILAPLGLLAVQSYSARVRRRQLAQLASPALLEQLTRSHSPARRAAKNILLILAVSAVGLALARPQWGHREETAQTLGEDVLFVLDCSRSMLATDVSPSRLQRARLAIQDYVQNHAHGRVGLVAFAGEAFLQCPLTFDYGAFDDALAAVDDKTIPVLGTDLGEALEEAARAVAKNEGRKILVLLTDGEDLEDHGVTTAQKLAKQNIIVFTVGVGTPAGSEIQILNEQGKPELVHDKAGNVVRSRLGEAALRSIATATHGAYYPLGALGEGVAKVRLALENIKLNPAAVPGQKLGVDRFYVFVGGLIGLLVFESLLGTRRSVKT